MNSRLYVGNLSFNTNEDALHRAFSRFGAVSEAKLVLDRETGQSRGFAFVTMADAESARVAASQLDGSMLDGRALRVNEAEERQQRGGAGGSGGGRRPSGGGARSGRGGDRW